MALDKLKPILEATLEESARTGIRKRHERIITGRQPPANGYGPRYLLDGYEGRAFLRMNSNSYLGLHVHPRVIDAEERAARHFGAGPGAVRFISGTHQPHIELEQRLADFHGREAAMIFSAAYAAVMGVLPQLITSETLVVSDALNHNSIINALRLAKPYARRIYGHLDIRELDGILEQFTGEVKRVLVVTDGVFSMRGDFAPLDEIREVCNRYQTLFEEGLIIAVDDSHGVGTLGALGRGTEERTAARADIVIATMGKALGVNGGYVAADKTVIDYLRETAPFYIYSNPMTPSETAAALEALNILDSDEGLALLERVRRHAAILRKGLSERGFETIGSEHPIVPLLIGDSDGTRKLVKNLFINQILATGIGYPVVPKGEEEIRFQVTAEHTEKDIGFLLDHL